MTDFGSYSDDGVSAVIRVPIRFGYCAISCFGGLCEERLPCYHSKVKAALAKGMDVNSSDGEVGGTALMWSIMGKHKSIAKLLLKQPGIDVNVKDADGQNALHVALENGDSEVVKLILKTENVDVNCMDPVGTAPIHYAVREGNVNIVRMFLTHRDVDVNLGCKDTGVTALMAAATQGRVEIVKLILAHPKVNVNLCDEKGRTALFCAAFTGTKKVLELFLADERLDATSVDATGYNVLHYAALANSADMVELIMNDPRFSSLVNKPNKNGETAVMLAVHGCKHNAVTRLLRYPSVDLDLKNKNGQSLEDLARY